MKYFKTIKFAFDKEDVDIIRRLWEMLQEIDDDAYDQLREEIQDDGSRSFYDVLDDLLQFAENNRA